MAKLLIFSIIVLSSILSVQPQTAPTPAPVVAPGALSPPAAANHSLPTPASFFSPPEPPPGPESSPSSAPEPSPSPTVSPPPPLPSPSPPPPSTAGYKSSNANANDESSGSPGGLKQGQKAGVAIGVIAAVCIVALGSILYRKRQRNIQRSQYGYAARSELL